MVYCILGLSVIIILAIAGIVENIVKSKNKYNDISESEIEKLVETKFIEDKIKEINEGKCTDSKLKDEGYVYALVPCSGYECSCSSQCEDCCKDLKMIDGKPYCKIYININNLCGVEEKKLIKDDEEIKELSDIIAKALIEHEKSENDKTRYLSSINKDFYSFGRI